MEWQAGYVCGAVLMPLTYVRRIVAAFQEDNGLFGPVKAASQHGNELVARIVDNFQVSREAAEIRLRVLGHLTDADAAPSLF